MLTLDKRHLTKTKIKKEIQGERKLRLWYSSHVINVIKDRPNNFLTKIFVSNFFSLVT